MTIVIAGRHTQERISFRMLLTSEPLSCTMPSSSVCHENPLHVIMGVCMSTSTTAIPGPCYLSRQKHDAPHSLSLTETAVLLRRLSGWDLPGGFVRRTRGLEKMSYFLTITGKWRCIVAVCSEPVAYPVRRSHDYPSHAAKNKEPDINKQDFGMKNTGFDNKNRKMRISGKRQGRLAPTVDF